MLRKLALLMALPIAALAVSGCDYVTGGGWLYGHGGDTTKATFGFTINADGHMGIHGTYHDSSFEYKDAGLGIKFVGEAFMVQVDRHEYWVGFNWESLGKPKCEDSGKAVKCTGTGWLLATDNGEPGVDDTFAITLHGSGLDYSNDGTIQGGNIQEHDWDD